MYDVDIIIGIFMLVKIVLIGFAVGYLIPAIIFAIFLYTNRR